MNETRDDIEWLSAIIEQSIDRAGAFLRSSFEIPDKTLSAEQLIAKLHGSMTLVLGTVTSTDAPRTAPVIALFYRGRFHIPTVRTALRTRHVLNNPEVSLSLYEGIDFAVIVHGTASLIGPSDPEFLELVELQRKHAGSDVREWGEATYLRVEPTHLYSFARYPDTFAGEPLSAKAK